MEYILYVVLKIVMTIIFDSVSRKVIRYIFRLMKNELSWDICPMHETRSTNFMSSPSVKLTSLSAYMRLTLWVCLCTMHACDCVCVFFLFQPQKKIFHMSLAGVHVCVQFAICKCWPIFLLMFWNCLSKLQFCFFYVIVLFTYVVSYNTR